MQRRHFCLAAASAPLFASPLARAADAFPNKPVRLIVPYAAGGGPDVMVRQFGAKLGEVFGQAIVVENKVGAGGVLAAQYVRQTAPDGYTVLVGSNSHLIQKIMQPSLKFDPVADFIPITTFGSSPSVLVVSASSPYKNVRELVAAIKAAPGKLNYASGGNGSAAHLGGATLLSLSGADAVHVPLKGSVEIPLSLLRGDTAFAFTIASTALPQVKGGKLRALAVTSAAPLAELPGVPTLQEVMHSDLAVQDFWFGFWVPIKTPPEVVATIYSATRKVLSDPAIKPMFETTGNTVVYNDSPQSAAAFVQAENTKWAKIIKLTGVTAS